MLEVPQDSHVFHLDITLPKRFSKDEVISRFISCDLNVLLEFIKDSNPTTARLSVQSKHSEEGPYTITLINSVSKAIDLEGKVILVCDGDGEQIEIADKFSQAGAPVLQQVWPRHSSLVRQ